MDNVKHCCKNCHFLNKAYRNDRGFEGNSCWSKEERDNLVVKDHYAASCWRGIWDTGIDLGLNDRLPVILTQSRRDKCFFVEYNPGMSYPAATELHHNRQLKRGHKYARIALGVSIASAVIAVASVVANLIMNI